ncbi:MAG: hypothetical protein ACRDFA_12185 [bacterium]
MRLANASTVPRTKTVKEAWTTLVADLPNGVTVQRLVDLMGIEQLSTRTTLGDIASAPQGVHEYDPVDYFRRIVAEDLAPEELRD